MNELFNPAFDAALGDQAAPCPFCGEDPFAAFGYETPLYFHIRCENDFCGVRPFVCKPSRSGALMAWNQRVSITTWNDKTSSAATSP
jgi:hypothetical protein